MRADADAIELGRLRLVHAALDRMPVNEKLTMLVASIIELNGRGATTAVNALISVGTLMAARLNAQQREAVAQHMRVEAGVLEFLWLN
jgi:hypothetical protein